MSKDFFEIYVEDISNMCLFQKVKIHKYWDKLFWLSNNSITNIKYIYYNTYPRINQRFLLYNYCNNIKDADKIYVSYKYDSFFKYSKSTIKSINNSKKFFLWSIEKLNLENLKIFYFFYKNFFIKKEIDYNNFSYFINMYKIFWDNLSILKLCDINNWNLLIGTTLILKFTDKVILMFWWYDLLQISKWLKYFWNDFIINYYKDNKNIKEVVFWTWKKEDDINDSLLKFKSKFWELKYLKKISN